MRPFSRHEESLALAEARLMRNPATAALSQSTFLGQFPPDTDWAIGPFERLSGLDFTPEGQWHDPAGIGWTSESIFNPTLIARDDELHLFYRASPKKESLASRIGHAVFTERDGWVDDAANPIVPPSLDNETLGVEDPKIYRADGRWFLFYNGIFAVTDADRSRYPSPGYPVDSIGCDINVAVSDDLHTWSKLGPVIDHDTSRLWAKGAVIPRDASGNAVTVGGEYLMFLSEGCDGVPHVGRSDDLRSWTFSPQPYLDLGRGLVHEVATAFVRDDRLVLDFFYDRGGVWSAGQALYEVGDPFHPIALTTGGTLAWGGIIDWRGRDTFAQGWDSPVGERSLQFYGRQLPTDIRPKSIRGEKP